MTLERLLRPTRTLVMGIVNVTPDSFSDGGSWATTEAALAHARQLIDDGADILDIGGESTRPGSGRVPLDEELARVIPVIEGLADCGIALSVDTMRAEVARTAIDAGAVLINDVSGGLADPAMPDVMAAATGAGYVLMHWRGHSEDMYALAQYDDVVAEVSVEMLAQVAVFEAAGVTRDRIVLDPGIGFAKRGEHNWSVLKHTSDFVELGFPVLVGASRKGFLSSVARRGEPTPAPERDLVTAVTSVLAAQAGAWAVRVHDVQGSVAALATLAAMEDAP